MTLISFEFSLLIECIQLVSKVGSFDVDDMILNTLGGSLGYLCFWVARKWKKRRNEKKEEVVKAYKEGLKNETDFSLDYDDVKTLKLR